MTVQSVDGFTRQGGGALGNDRKIIDAVFSSEVLEERQNSQPVPIGEDSVVVLRVTDHKPSQQLPLEQVQGQIVARLTEEKGRAAALQAANALAKRIEAGESLETAAAAAGAAAFPAQAVNRQGPTTEGAAPMVPELLKTAFQMPRPEATGKASTGVATLASGDPAVIVVTAARPGTPEAFGSSLAEQASALSQQHAAAEFTAYVEQLRQEAKIKRNAKLFATE
jgi:peptidyl-prolyl cis-trans isomerase D